MHKYHHINSMPKMYFKEVVDCRSYLTRHSGTFICAFICWLLWFFVWATYLSSLYVCKQTISIPMGTNCVPLLAYLFLHDYETDLLQGLFKNKDRKLAQSFISSFCYLDDVLSSLNNSRFVEYLHLIYSHEFEEKNTSDT